MLPQGSSSSNSSQGTGVYGPWPVSGEIDVSSRIHRLFLHLSLTIQPKIMEARGNLPSYPAQGSNYVRSSLNYGPFAGGSTPISQGEFPLMLCLGALMTLHISRLEYYGQPPQEHLRLGEHQTWKLCFWVPRLRVRMDGPVDAILYRQPITGALSCPIRRIFL